MILEPSLTIKSFLTFVGYCIKKYSIILTRGDAYGIMEIMEVDMGRCYYHRLDDCGCELADNFREVPCKHWVGFWEGTPYDVYDTGEFITNKASDKISIKFKYCPKCGQKL